MNNSYERRRGKSPAYIVSEYGLIKECDQILEKHYPLYWRKEPISKERLKELFEQSGGKPLAYARLIEKEIWDE